MTHVAQQQTLRRSVTYSGIGLHSGNRVNMTFAPGAPNSGIRFRRVELDGKPIRERKSIEWCLKGVDQCWSQKQRFIKADEKEDALAVYDHARKVYQQRLTEAE